VTGIAWRSSKVPSPPKSWREFFDLAKDGRLGKVSLLDDQREVLGAALLALGRSPNSRDAGEIAAARDLVKAAKANVAKFDSDDPATSLTQGETVLAQGWSGMFANGRMEDPEITFTVPSEGAFQYVDNWSIPKSAPDPDLAHAFIDFLMRPEIAAKLVNLKLYASVVETAKASIAPEILAGYAYADGAGVKLWWVEDAGPAGDAYAEAWRDLKSE
jgi:spermidine/putrescine transport system substrate-binding protein